MHFFAYSKLQIPTFSPVLEMGAAIWYYIGVLREKDECSLTYRSGGKAGRSSHASGEVEWSVRGVGNLTRAAYATGR